MARTRYIVAYDVADDKRRDLVFKVLRDNGEHLQYSVFVCDLNDREVIDMKRRLKQAIHHREDQVLLVDLGPVDGTAATRVEALGKAFEPPVRVLVV